MITNNKIKEDIKQMFWEPAIDYANAIVPITFETDVEIIAQQERWDKIHRAYGKGVEDVLEFIIDAYDIRLKIPTKYCKCKNPDRDMGQIYCKKCHKDISNGRIRFLANPGEKFEIPVKEDEVDEARRRLQREFEYNNMCARATLYPGKSIEEVNRIQLKEKIERVYNEINAQLCNENSFNDEITKGWVRKTLRQEFGNLTAVKCDDENNPPDVVDQQLLIARIIWNTDYSNQFGYKYVEMIFGNPEAVNKYQQQQLIDNETFNFIQKGI